MSKPQHMYRAKALKSLWEARDFLRDSGLGCDDWITHESVVEKRFGAERLHPVVHTIFGPSDSARLYDVAYAIDDIQVELWVRAKELFMRPARTRCQMLSYLTRLAQANRTAYHALGYYFMFKNLEDILGFTVEILLEPLPSMSGKDNWYQISFEVN